MSRASDPARIERQRQSADYATREARLDLLHVLSTPRGRNFVWRILGICRMNELSFAGEAPLTMAMNEGRRAVGNQILAELNEHAPDAFILMLREQQRTASQAESADDEPREETRTDG